MTRISNRILIEHNLEFITAISDYMIDLGSVAGNEGGTTVIQGDPEKVVSDKSSSWQESPLFLLANNTLDFDKNHGNSMAMLKDGNKMPRISARLIGKQVGKNAHEVYLMLEKIGFIKKGNAVTLSGSYTWDITELGRLHGESSHHPYSSGYIWDQDVVDIIKKAFLL